MRPIRYILDLPWWIGLAIFLAGNAIVPHLYLIGMPIAIFGAWTFSKLMKYDDWNEIGFAIIGFPLFFLVMLIPDRFAFETPYIDLLNHISPKVNFAVRAALGIMMALVAFRGVRR